MARGFALEAQKKAFLEFSKVNAERPGLSCYGKAGPYDGPDSWTEAF